MGVHTFFPMYVDKNRLLEHALDVANRRQVGITSASFLLLLVYPFELWEM